MPSEDDASELVARRATDLTGSAPAVITAPSAASPARSPAMARSATLVAAGIILSRLFGLVRQRIFAHHFGVSVFADAITAAFQVGNITQNLLGEGTLSASFVPIYAKLRAGGRVPPLSERRASASPGRRRSTRRPRAKRSLSRAPEALPCGRRLAWLHPMSRSRS